MLSIYCERFPVPVFFKWHTVAIVEAEDEGDRLEVVALRTQALEDTGDEEVTEVEVALIAVVHREVFHAVVVPQEGFLPPQAPLPP